MDRVTGSALVLAALLSCGGAAAAAAQPEAAPATQPFRRNWSPPAYKVKGQVLVDAVMAQHPELLGLTIHAIPPGGKEFTMFAASYHDRIGKASGPDDAMVTTLGRIMVETRYKPTDKKAVVLLPLEDAAGEDVATVVFGFHDDIGSTKTAAYYVSAALQMRDALRPQIASHDDLFAKAN
jgi:hypothetical protein